LGMSGTQVNVDVVKMRGKSLAKERGIPDKGEGMAITAGTLKKPPEEVQKQQEEKRQPGWALAEREEKGLEG